MKIDLNLIYIISQISVFIGFVVVCSTYFSINRNHQLLSMIVVNILFGLSVVLLDGYIGAAMCVIAILRDVVSKIIYANRPSSTRGKNTPLDYALLALWTGLIFITTYFIWDGFISLLASFGTLAFTVSIWQKKSAVIQNPRNCQRRVMDSLHGRHFQYNRLHYRNHPINHNYNRNNKIFEDSKQI